jgi:hypothetical protein
MSQTALPIVPPGAAAIWNNLAHPAPGVGNVPPVAGDDMNVKVKYSLTGRFSYVGPDVVAIGAKIFL